MGSYYRSRDLDLSDLASMVIEMMTLIKVAGTATITTATRILTLTQPATSRPYFFYELQVWILPSLCTG